MIRNPQIMDGNSAAAHIAYACNEVIAIYPITPSSNMAQETEEKAAAGDLNIWEQIPTLMELQSESGAAATVHGAIAAGALATTFTASQGLLLMIPNMHKIAGELTPTVFYVTARTIASHALSIFCDHSDIMSIRNTGFAILFANNVQEAMDMALIAQNATLETRIPFVVAFDGFRTSHELSKIDVISYAQIKDFINPDALNQHRIRRLSPDKPHIQGTAQNPDVFFQSREAGNTIYQQAEQIIAANFAKFEQQIERKYSAFEYIGNANATEVIIAIGSACDTIEETLHELNNPNIGLLKVRLFRPFYAKQFIHALPQSVRKIAVLDRTKEAGALGEPLYLDIKTALYEAWENEQITQLPIVISGRYGLGSKEFTPAMVCAVYENLTQEKTQLKRQFVIGIEDDVTNLSLNYANNTTANKPHEFSGKFYGLGSDGTVSANKNSIKIIGENTTKFVQGFFEYDSKKSGSYTISHLRFGNQPIQSAYLVEQANFIACHEFSFLRKYDMLNDAMPNSTFLIASPYPLEKLWDNLPYEIQAQIIAKNIHVYCVEAQKIAAATGMGKRINTIMQVAFFKISNILPIEQAITAIKNSISKAYAHKGDKVIARNFAAVDLALDSVQQLTIPSVPNSTIHLHNVDNNQPEFIQKIIAPMLQLKGDKLPVSAMPIDGVWPSATSQYEKRDIAINLPEWEQDTCIQCGYCTLVCPHAAIRMKVFDSEISAHAPAEFKSMPAKIKGFENKRYTLQVYPDDCTGCEACVTICTAIDKATGRRSLEMVAKDKTLVNERENAAFFDKLDEVAAHEVKGGIQTLKGSQLMQPLFEFSGACSGCGETPYIKLLTQLLGDRLMIANATGCSSIFGGNLPTTPYCTNDEGRGPSWSNSLFEDNAEFALGMKLAEERLHMQALHLLTQCQAEPSLQNQQELIVQVLTNTEKTPAAIHVKRELIKQFKTILTQSKFAERQQLAEILDHVIAKSVWAIGGDGWAYDIGYGGLDHVAASGKNVKMLILDTESYSNTGGQMSKATPFGAVAKLATSGKDAVKKDLGQMLMSYKSVYVAQICMVANPMQAIKALSEAEAYDGPAVVIAYSPCIAHGMDMVDSNEHQKKAVQSGYWLLYRYNPDLTALNKNPLVIDSKEPTLPLIEYLASENRFKLLSNLNNETQQEIEQLQANVITRFKYYQHLAKFINE